jgi:hypothetical protein
MNGGIAARKEKPAGILAALAAQRLTHRLAHHREFLRPPLPNARQGFMIAA